MANQRDTAAFKAVERVLYIYTHQNYETSTQQYILYMQKISQKYVEESKANKCSGGDRCIW